MIRVDVVGIVDVENMAHLNLRNYGFEVCCDYSEELSLNKYSPLFLCYNTVLLSIRMAG